MTRLVKPAALKELGSSVDILDVRREADFRAAPGMIPGARKLDPEAVEQWLPGLDRKRPLVVYCARGGSVSRGVAEKLAAAGLDVSVLEGGIAGFQG